MLSLLQSSSVVESEGQSPARLTRRSHVCRACGSGGPNRGGAQEPRVTGKQAEDGGPGRGAWAQRLLCV